MRLSRLYGSIVTLIEWQTQTLKMNVSVCDKMLKEINAVKNTKEQSIFSYEWTFISYICICTPKVQHLLICRNRFFFFMYTIDRGKNSCIFLSFFLDIVSPPHIRSAFTSKLQQLYKEGRPRKVRWGKQVVGRSETGYQLCLGDSQKDTFQ